MGCSPILIEYARQILKATAANLTSTHKRWSQIDTDGDLQDVPVTFFFDADGLVNTLGLPVTMTPLAFPRNTYHALADKYDLRVRGFDIDLAGDVPFCFTVPERALEDVLALAILVENSVISRRLAATLLMVDFPNPVGSPVRAKLLKYIPTRTGVNQADEIDLAVTDRITAAAENTAAHSPERMFAQNWSLAPDGWPDAYAAQINAYLAAVTAALKTEPGADGIFRLAESRRREFRGRALNEFDLTLPRAEAIPPEAPSLVMSAGAVVSPRSECNTERPACVSTRNINQPNLTPSEGRSNVPISRQGRHSRTCVAQGVE